MNDVLERLNPQQVEAVTTVHGPILVLAGPGSGKTRVLTRRITYLIDEADVGPWNILAVTFTNKAAREMRERVELIFADKFGKPLPGNPPRLGGLTIGTFHAICARVLRVEADSAGYERNWVIYDTSDQLALLRALLREMKLDEKRYSPQAIRAYIGRQKNELLLPGESQTQTYFEEIAGRVYARYQEALHINNAVDFDDLLTKTAILLRDNVELRAKYQQKWQFLLVDEFQDTNTAQYELLRLLANEPEGKRNLFVVGDEDQSIYRFRGADYRNVKRFRETYPEAKVVLLEQNYRSTQTILDVANAVIANNRNRTPKKLHTDNGQGLPVTVYEAYNEVEEAAFVGDEIERLSSSGVFSYGDFAIMYRTNAQSRALEETFVLRQMKYKLVGATRFYERKEIKDVMAYVRLVHNPSDSVALDRIINQPARGIGPKTYGALKSWVAEVGISEYLGLLLLHHGAENVIAKEHVVLPEAAYAVPSFGKRAENALVNFAAMLEKWVDQGHMEQYSSVAELMDDILQESSYVDVLRDGTDDGEERFANLQELRGVAAQYMPGMAGMQPEQTPLSMFLEEVSLVSDTDDLDATSGAVTLLTLHTAKGLEYPVVFVVGMEDGILPHNRSLESGDPEDMDEERRLCYVGITRAKKRLYLVHALRRSLWGSSELQSQSRFFDEMPVNLLSGMVNRRAKREAGFQRSTSWDGGHGSGQKWGGRERPRGLSDTWDGARGDTDKQEYWSPDAGTAKGASGRSASARRAKSKASADPNGDAVLQYRRRDAVQHAKFGVGTVIESNLTGGEEEVTVAFPGVGIKRLLVCIAGLKKL